jgi:hypothetical protein
MQGELCDGCIIMKLVLTLLLGVSIAFLVYLGQPTVVFFLVCFYVPYLCISHVSGDIRKWLGKMRKYEDYYNTYDKMAKGTGYFTF